MRWAVPSSTAGAGTLAGLGTLCTGAPGVAGASAVAGAFGWALGGALGWVWAQTGAAISMAATRVDGTTRTSMLAPQRSRYRIGLSRTLAYESRRPKSARSCRECVAKALKSGPRQ